MVEWNEMEKGKVEDEVEVETVRVWESHDEARSGISFPLQLDDHGIVNQLQLQLHCVGLRTKSVLGLRINIYAFGIYADNEKVRDVMKLNVGGVRVPSKEMYSAVVDSDVGIRVRMVIVFPGLTMAMVRANFDQGLGASIKALTSAAAAAADDYRRLAHTVLGQVKGSIRLTAGSVIDISRLPGHVLHTRVGGEVISEIESELLCRAFVNLYLGDRAFDKHAKHKFGMSLRSLF